MDNHIADVANPHAVTKSQVGLGNVTNVDFETLLKRLKGISLTQNDLLYMYNHNTKLIATCEADESWADNKWDGTHAATHGDDTTNYKVGSQGISVTTDATANLKAVNLDFTDKDLTKFEDGSVSIDDDYIELSVYCADASDGTSAQIAFMCDTYGTKTNWYTYTFTSLLVDGCNHLKIQKSSFGETGSPSWATITGVVIRILAAVGETYSITIDAIRMTRKDPTDANPNPFQIENDGVMERVMEVSSGTPFLGYDGSTLVVKGMENTNLYSIYTFSKFWYSGSFLTSSTAAFLVSIYDDDDNRMMAYTSSDRVIVKYDIDPLSDYEQTDISFNAEDEVIISGVISVSSVQIALTKDGITYPQYIAAVGSIDPSPLRISVYSDASLTSFKASSSPLMVNQ